MKKVLILIPLACICLAGCQPANIVASKWDSGIPAANSQLSCERVDMRAKSEMDDVTKKYDGWKMVYLSEYTTGNKAGTDAAICFERAK